MYDRDGVALRDHDPSRQSPDRDESRVQERERPGATSAPLELPGSLAPVQRRREGHDPLGASLSDSLGALGDVGGGHGGLEPSVRTDMESFFGQSFGDVQVKHDSSNAARIGARAYTQGNEVHFAPGAYEPGTSSGRALIGHELAHVVQQRAGRVEATDQLAATGQPLNAQAHLEQEADDLGRQAAGHRGGVGAPVQTKSTGASASGGGGVVQGYFDYDPAVSGNYAMSAGATFESQHLVHGLDAEYRRTVLSAGANPGQVNLTETRHDGANWVATGGGGAAGLPPLHIAHDGQMAIEKTQAQPREFYCDANLVAAANQALSDNVSDTALLQDGETIQVPRTDPLAGPPGGTRTLHRVRPGQRAGGLGPIMARASYAVTECNNVMKQVIGEHSRDEILGRGGDTTRVSTTEPVYEVAERMTAPGSRAPQLADEISQGTRRVGEPAKAHVEATYSTMGAGDRQRRARRLGINEHAAPEIGEGYVVNSLKSTLPSKMNTTFDGAHARQRYRNALNELDAADLSLDVFTSGLSDDAKALKKNIWGNHYAGVVARSGPDTVTLENYNRAQERKWEFSHIFDALYQTSRRFRRKVWQMRASLAARDEAAQRDIIQDMTTTRADLNALLVRARAACARVEQAPGGSMLYFQMYGAGTQSFHAKMAGITANPLTMRTGYNIERSRPDHLRRNDQNADQISQALVNARILTPGIDGVALQGFRIQAEILRGQITTDIENATTLRDMRAANARINVDYRNLRDQIRDQLAIDLVNLGVNAPNLHGQPLNVLQAELIQQANNAHIGARVRGRGTARNRKRALMAMRDIANSI